MDKAQKKALTEEWKNRRPEMGVISLRCKETGDSEEHTSELQSQR